MAKEIRKVNRSGEKIATLIHMPKDLSLKLARLIIDKSERGEQITKPDLIISYIEKGVQQEVR